MVWSFFMVMDPTFTAVCSKLYIMIQIRATRRDRKIQKAYFFVLKLFKKEKWLFHTCKYTNITGCFFIKILKI